MPYACENLTNQQKSQINGIRIETYDDNIKLNLKLDSSLVEIGHTISYNKFGSFVTTVQFGNKESPLIELNYVDVFLEDLEMFLKHRKSVLRFLDVNFYYGTVEDCSKICKRLEKILKSRRIIRTLFSETTVAQATSIAKYSNQKAVDPKNFEKLRKRLEQVKTEHNGRYISFEFADRSVRSKRLQKEIPTNCGLSESVARTVFETRLTMQLILRHLQCFDIDRLRKVNRGIRECVSLIKPNPHIKTYCISTFRLEGSGFLRTYIGLENGKFKDFRHCKIGNKVRVSGRNSFPGADFVSMCLNDMENTLNYQMECIKELIVCYECTDAYFESYKNHTRRLASADLFRRIGDSLRKRETPLKTRKFTTGSGSQMEVMEVLSAIDSHSLKIIEFLYPTYQHLIENKHFGELPFQVDQLSETNQWNNAEHLMSKYLTITTPIHEMNILHFVNLEIIVKTISSEDVAYMRTNLLNSSKFQKYKISFRESTIDGTLHTLIGEPYRIVSDFKKVWYFRIQNTNVYIHIVLDTRDAKDRKGNLKPKLITFTRVAKEDTPFFELPMNQLVIN